MDYTQLFTRMFALYLIITSFGVLINKEIVSKFIDEFKKNPALIYTVGAISLLLGAFMIQVHNDWTSIHKIIISFLGWAILIKGALALLIPNTFLRLAHHFETPKQITAWATLPLILGMYLGYIGYLA